jgi:DNA (cytosine-5)-methyltransferase 1
MREVTGGRYPRFGVWENVPGALSSNKGEDFRCVLESLARVVDKDATVPRSPRGKWTTSGMVAGNGWSIAWRVLDAKHFGVAQRRRRIVLVADFGSERAAELLFEREGVPGDLAESGEAGQGAASDVGSDATTGGERVLTTVYAIQGNMIGRSDTAGPGGKGYDENISFTLTKTDRHAIASLQHGVRYLTPRESERLQGFQDDWTLSAVASKRYQAMGDSIAIPVFSWLFKLIKRELERGDA